MIMSMIMAYLIILFWERGYTQGGWGGGQDCMLIPPIKFICILNPLIEKEAPSSPSQELTVQKS